MRTYRFALRPGWLVLHLVTVALIVTMVLLGRWQLTVSERKGFSVQNFGYALQWWAFCGFTALMWGRILRDHARRAATAGLDIDLASPAPAPALREPVAYRRYVAPATVPAQPEDDPVRAAYNDYLARLNAEN